MKRFIGKSLIVIAVLLASVTPGVEPALAENVNGWAAMAGMGLETTTGGGSGRTVVPNDANTLRYYAARNEALNIEIPRSLSVADLVVTSNKTITGRSGTHLNGGIRIRGETEYVSNVILRNIKLNAASTAVDGDGIHITHAHHIWLDHVEVYDAPDGNLDIVRGSSYVTVSWSKFYYTPNMPDPGHKLSTLISHGSFTGTDYLRVTFHHNYWAEGIVGRMPKINSGMVHMYNNYFRSPGNSYNITAYTDSVVLLEFNYFYKTNNPHRIGDSSVTITGRGNRYYMTTGSIDYAGETPEIPYDYSLDGVIYVPGLVTASAGAN